MNIGIYCGSFNPFHRGHYDIALQAERIFDKLIIARGKNPAKSDNKTLEETIPNCFEVMHFETSLSRFYIDLVDNDLLNTYFLVRGIRNGCDLAYEDNLRKVVEDYTNEKGIKARFVYLFCSRENEHISSGMIRSMSQFEDVSNYMVRR